MTIRLTISGLCALVVLDSAWASGPPSVSSSTPVYPSSSAAVPPANGASLVPSPRAEQEPSAPVVTAPPPTPEVLPPLPAACPDPCRALQAPVLSEGQAPPRLSPAQSETTDKPLPINLPTALRLAGARPVIIAAAQARVQVAAEVLAKAQVEWLP
jgi:hypothetical protein